MSMSDVALESAGLAVSQDSSLLASISTDRSVKVFDVKTLDMMAMLRLPFTPSCIEWIFKVGLLTCVIPAHDLNPAHLC